MRIRVTLLALIVAVCVLQAGDRLSLSTSGSYATAPADAWVRIRLDPTPADRLLVLSVNGDPGEERTSEIAVDGWHVRQVFIKALSAGCYHIAAALVGSSGQILAVAYAPNPLAVMGKFSEGNPCD